MKNIGQNSNIHSGYQPEDKIDTSNPPKEKDWTKPVNGMIDVPDELMPLFNRIGFQFRIHTISGQSEVLCIARCVKAAQEFFTGVKPVGSQTKNPACALSRNPEHCCIFSIAESGCSGCGHFREIKEVANKLDKQLELF